MKRALLVGINVYPGQPLNGCVNDVTDAAAYLVNSAGFAMEDVRLLTDSRATTAEIRARLDWLLGGAAPGDTVYFHYSGHGTKFPIRDAAGNVTENHGAICPVDFDWTRERVLLDTDLRDIFNRAPAGAEFIFVSDSCNSGSLTRAIGQPRPRFYFPPADIAWRIATAEAKGLAPSLLTTHDRCGLISGCTFEQESADAFISGRYNGALTYFLLQALAAPGGAALALTGLVPDVRRRLEQHYYPQEPQLHGPDDILGRPFLHAA